MRQSAETWPSIVSTSEPNFSAYTRMKNNETQTHDSKQQMAMYTNTGFVNTNTTRHLNSMYGKCYISYLQFRERKTQKTSLMCFVLKQVKMVEHIQIKSSINTTYQHILVEGRSTFSSLLPDKLTQAPPLGDSPYCRKKTACLQCQNCSHFSCRTAASQGPHRAPKCTLQKINSN